MKWSRRGRTWAKPYAAKSGGAARTSAWAAVILLLAGGAAHADLARWIQDIPSPSALQAVFFKPTPMRRPPQETRAELTKLIQASPSQADLYALRAHEDELQLDFAAAEADWTKAGSNLALADFYHRRIRPREEIAALEAAGTQEAFERIQSVIQEQALPASLAVTEYRAWAARFPTEAVYQKAFHGLVALAQNEEAAKLLSDYRRAFPGDSVFPVQAEAKLAADPLRVYDQNFKPLWPSQLISSYFELLKQRHALRQFLAQSRAQAIANSGEIAPAARLFYYYQQQQNPNSALRALYEYRQRKTTWTADEYWTLGQLFEAAHNYDEAARAYYGLYSSNPERALVALADVLLTAPDQPIRYGSGDLSFYRDIAAMDPGPGFLNGILSLLFNSTGPRYQYDTENQASRAYFHRAMASELITQIDGRFPNATQRAGLHAKLIDAYATYGDSAGVLRAGQEFLSRFPKAEQRTQVALAMADAFARQGKEAQEFAIYDDVLKELAANAGDMPIGEATQATREGAAPPAHSPEYARVLDRYIGRLVALKRVRDALALYRREIGRNPKDPGLYVRLAAFLDQNKMGADIEQVYRQALQKFQDPSRGHKLARWYLRQKQTAQFDALTREVVKIFSGTELEAYLQDLGQPLAPALYRQVNLYAHQRFPYDLMFVRNLITAYGNRATADPAAIEALLRQNWYSAPDLRDRFFELLSRTGRLKAELAALPRPDATANPATAEFAAQAEAWQSHFEAAAPLLREVAARYPGDVDQQTEAASIERSLGRVEAAASIEENVTKYAPRDTGALARVGDIYADKEQFNKAAPFWNRIAAVEPGKPDGYIEAATVFWDYYRFDDALRLIREGRQKLKNDRLYSYEAGAIYENRREYGKAIEEYAKGDGQSRARLIELGRRPSERELVDRITSHPADTVASVSLRVDVLNAQNRAEDARQFMQATASSSSSMEVLRWLDDTAAQRGLDQVQEQCKLRVIALTTDPVEHMQAQLALVHYYEGRHDTASGNRAIADLYRSNPTVLGVVRATVDYYWRTKDSKRAVDTLEQAANAAQAPYRNPFRLEAARKATEAGDYTRARALLATLLKQEPFQPQYIAAMADTYARRNDDRGMRDFYTDRLKLVQDQASAAAIRRALIPVLTRLKDYAAAVDQYIEILNRYPEDADLARQAAAYASTHGRAPQLAGYYENTSNQSPKDYRWPLVEARIQTQLENFTAAVAAYKRAAEIRPDRIEFYTERAGLEERLLQFDDAAATYAKLYDLNYHNSIWMEKLATVRARQGQNDAAIQAVNAAFIDGKPARPDAYFAVAQRLESWALLNQAKDYAAKGVAMAGADLLTDYYGGAQTYTRILTRLHQYDALAQSVKLDDGLKRTMGAVVAQYFTPAEKSAFASFIGTRLQTFLPAIQSAGLLDLQARALARKPGELAGLQQRRLRFGELASQLEAYWRSLAPQTENRDSYLEMAAQNFRLAGDGAGELRSLALKAQQGALTGMPLERYAELIAANPQRLETVMSSDVSEEVRDAVANYVLRRGSAQQSLRVVSARGRSQQPVWTKAYTALTGLYFLSNTPAVNDAYRDALGAGLSIGDRIGKPVDRNQQLSGDIWFYYGSRYGEYLGDTKQADAEDYLPSAVEGRPGNASGYFDLGEYYKRANLMERAMTEYRHVLELASDNAGAHDRMAVILLQQGKRDEATSEFREALNAAAHQQDERHVIEGFWTDLQTTLEDIGRAKLLDPLRPDAERVLRTYIRRNSNYRVEPLLEGALAASGMTWVIDLSRAAPDQATFLSAIVNAEWIPEAQRASVYRAMIDAVAGKPDRQEDLRRYQTEFVTYLIEHKHGLEAQAALAEVPRSVQPLALEIRVAALTNSLPALLNRFAADPEIDSKLDEMRNASSMLERQAATQVLEFVYTRQIEAQQLSTAVFLGLAEIRLEQGDVAGAVALLRRMSMIVGEPFDNLMDAADLLIRTGHRQEAQPFLEQRVKAVPWDISARRLLENKIEIPVSPAAAEKPYDDHSRIVAAASTKDLTVKIRLLQGAIAINPAPAQPKLDLIRAALEAKRWNTATSAAIYGDVVLTKDLQNGIGQAYEALGDLVAAQNYYRGAGADAAVRRIQGILNLREENERRRPVIKKDLEQDGVVHPKLGGAR